MDLDACRALIVEAYAEGNGKLYLDTAKSRGRRSVPIPRSLAEELKPPAQGRGEEQLLFTAPQGGPLRARNFRQRFFAPAVVKARLGHLKVTPHKLRHTAGPATRQRVHSTLRAALNAAIAQQLITFNPAARVELEAGKRPEALVWTDERIPHWKRTGEKPSPVMVWTPEHTDLFLDHVAEDRLYALFHLIAFRGLRRGEACGQQWTDTHLDAGLITVAKQLVVDGWEVYEDDPKTDTGARTIALDSDTVQALKRHRAQQDKDREEWGERLGGDRPRLHPGERRDAPPRQHHPAVRRAVRGDRPSAGPAPRPAARGRDAGPRGRGRPEGHPGDARPLLDHHHGRHVHEPAARGGSGDRRGRSPARTARPRRLRENRSRGGARARGRGQARSGVHAG
ncbi:hypothetical protein GCM10027162_17210 [Streptomyces incanus]